MGYPFAKVATFSTIPLSSTKSFNDDDTTSTAFQLTVIFSAASRADQVATSLDNHLPSKTNKNSECKCEPNLISSLIAGREDIANYAREEHIVKPN